MRTDYVRDGAEGRLRKLSVEKGLLREVESIQLQIKALLKCAVRCPQVFGNVRNSDQAVVFG